ncbi:MAG: hypothetical protein ABS879_06530 [Eubacteriales bacterium]
MSIILTILKVIGIILLIILLIILAILLLVLFVPIRYSAGGRKEGDVLEFSGKVTWFLRAVTVQIGYEPGRAGLTKDLRIFGISLFKLRDKLRSGKKGGVSADSAGGGNTEKAGADEIALPEAEGVQSDPGTGTEAAGAVELSAEADFGKDASDTLSEDGGEVPAAQKETVEEVPFAQPEGEEVPAEQTEEGGKPETGTSRIRAVYNKLTDRLFSVLSGIALRLNGIIGKLFSLVLKVFIKICLLPITIVEKLDKILRKIGSICRKIGAVYDFFFDERVQAFLSQIMGLIRKLIGHVLPKKLIGYVRFGLDDPGYTGRVLAAVAPFYPKYGRSFSVQPDFEDLVLEGKAELKGRVYLFYVAYIGLRAILNKNTKYVIRELKKLKEVR